MLFEGLGIQQNIPKGIEWLEKAAKNNCRDAQFELGMLHRVGLTDTSTPHPTTIITPNDSKAFEWVHRAATQGNPKAQYWLGMFYDNGEGTVQDVAQACRWYRLAAEQVCPLSIVVSFDE